MRRRTRTPTSFWRCGHISPVAVEEVEGGNIARCLMCGELGPVREGLEEAVRALRDRARQRDEAQRA